MKHNLKDLKKVWLHHNAPRKAVEYITQMIEELQQLKQKPIFPTALKHHWENKVYVKIDEILGVNEGTKP